MSSPALRWRHRHGRCSGNSKASGMFKRLLPITASDACAIQVSTYDMVVSYQQSVSLLRLPPHSALPERLRLLHTSARGSIIRISTFCKP